MAEDRPWLFATIPSLTTTTLLHTARRSTAESPQEYRFTVQALVDFLGSQYDILPIQGIYDSDSAAAADGVAVGELYELSLTNIYGLPDGLLKRRRE